MVQLSRYSLVVPVLTAAGNGRFKIESEPNIGARAMASERIEVIKYACSARITCSGSRGFDS